SYDKVTITTEKNTSFTLLDLTGKVLKTFDVNQQGEISISELASGIYLLKENSTGSQTKIIKQ
ncbi:MAG TPA: T9SS type A sorting domain-containing protein, partial [Brumimicrobium sp.]|nr:T9SS type A sorting domain-containing protein [Brumimicrobium sp.]